MTSRIDLGQLMCDGLSDAPESSLLRFRITSNQVISSAMVAFGVLDFAKNLGNEPKDS